MQSRIKGRLIPKKGPKAKDKFKRAGSNYVIFKTNTLFEEHTKRQGMDGREIVFDSSFQPELHCRIYGEVTQIPVRLTPGIIIMGESVGNPPYEDSSPYHYRFLNHIEMDVQLGDRIYFHWHTMMPQNLEKSMVKEEWTGKREKGSRQKIYDHYLKVRYDQILCAIRDYDYFDDWARESGYEFEMKSKKELVELNGQKIVLERNAKGKVNAYLDGYKDKYKMSRMIPIGSWCLIEPEYESWESILRPTPVIGDDGKPLLKENGKPVLKPKDQWLQIKVAPEAKFLRGYVRAVGKPLKGETCEIAAGDHILYRRDADWMVKIEGEIYYCIRQRHIEAKI